MLWGLDSDWWRFLCRFRGLKRGFCARNGGLSVAGCCKGWVAQPILKPSRSGFACSPAYGGEVAAFGDDFVPGTKVPGFYLEARCASGVLNFVKGAEIPVVGQFDLGVKLPITRLHRHFRVTSGLPVIRPKAVNECVGDDAPVQNHRWRQGCLPGLIFEAQPNSWSVIELARNPTKRRSLTKF